MISPITNTSNTNNNKKNVFKNFQKTAKTCSFSYTKIKQRRIKTTERLTTPEKIGVAAGAISGTVIPMLIFAKKQNRNILNLDFGLKEMLIVGASAIAGGTISGILFGKTKNHKKKIDESIFQLFNASIPPLLYTGLSKIQKKTKFAENKLATIANSIFSLTAGMYIAAKTANLVIDPHNKIPDRKLKMQDALVNIDDALGVFALAKFPLISKLHPEKVLPVIYSWCGYRAGQSN